MYRNILKPTANTNIKFHHIKLDLSNIAYHLKSEIFIK